MRKMIVVAVREYQATVRTKAFIVSLLAMPIFFGGTIVVQILLKDKVDTRDKRVAIVDHTGVLFESIAEAAQGRNEATVYEGKGPLRKKVHAAFVVEEVKSATDDDTQLMLDLSERVRDEELLAFIIVGPDVIDGDDGSSNSSIAYYSNAPLYEHFRRWVKGVLNHRISALRLEAADLDADIVRKAIRDVSVTNLGLVEVDEAGNVTEAKESNEFANVGVPIILMMLMLMLIMVGAAPLMQSVLEEKMQRIAEVLLGSIPPFQLMMGKLLGMVGVSLTLGTVYIAGGFVAINQAGYADLFPAHVIWWFVLFQALAVLMFGSVFIAIGSAFSDFKEAQSALTPVMLLVMSPMFIWLHVVEQPTSTLSFFASLFPPATPMLMVLRQAVPPGVPLWQLLLGIALVLLTTIACVFAASRIFRVGILMHGKGAGLSEMFHWVFRG
jgi:ABC-2 type transport system permease protein